MEAAPYAWMERGSRTCQCLVEDDCLSFLICDAKNDAHLSVNAGEIKRGSSALSSVTAQPSKRRARGGVRSVDLVLVMLGRRCPCSKQLQIDCADNGTTRVPYEY
jgi:hypothetical protein